MARQAIRAAVLALLLACPLRAQQLELRFLDVGQGDAALLRVDKKTVLVDAGPSPRIVGDLKALGVESIDLVVSSHNHKDHIGGMPAVLGAFRVLNYMDNALPHPSAVYRRTLQAVKASDAQYRRPERRTFNLGDARIHVLPPPPGQDTQNNSSVGLLIEYGEFRALLTGDSEHAELAHWRAHEAIPRVQVLKVAHHGSWNGTTPAWVEATRPKLAVISVGSTNSYGHPSPATIAQWESAGADVRRTDRDGTIVVLAEKDGSFRVESEDQQVFGLTALPPPLDTEHADKSSEVAPGACCRVCSIGKACGNSCISRRYTCHRQPGCACDSDSLSMGGEGAVLRH